jgi:hypothetical protein
MRAGHEDANLILRLCQLRREGKMREARDWFSRNYTARNLEEFQVSNPGHRGSGA